MENDFSVTREKHLDHMVRVVPFIVVAYAIQCYLIMRAGPAEFSVNGLFFLGACLTLMITGFIVYDLTHVVTFEADNLTISMSWLGYKEAVSYQNITQIEVSDPGQSFSTLILKTSSGKKYGFYFIDDADKIKSWLEQKRLPELRVAA
jgi:hypothetical protein